VAAAAFGAGMPAGVTTLIPNDIAGRLPGGADILADERARFSAEIGSAPRLDTVDGGGIASVVRSLDDAVRRQFRLATLLHDQAEAIPRRRRPAEPISQNVRKPLPGPDRRPVPDIDLAGLEAALDAAGEVLAIAAERLAERAPMQAVHLLASVRLPTPAGFPGRVFTQESLAQARPLAELGVMHRLAIARWAADALDTLHRRRLSLAERLAFRAAEHPHAAEHGRTTEEPGGSPETSESLSEEHEREGEGPHGVARST
jgi:hypothetical protein